jgi:hypothetical protein
MDERETGLQKAIVPRIEKTVDFYGDDVPVAQAEDGELYVPIRPITRYLGVSFSGQRERIMRDEVLSKKVQQVMMKGADGKNYEQLSLPLEMIPGWLFGVSTSRVRDELKEKLNRYRAECFKVLWNTFKQDIAPTQHQPSGLSSAEQTLEMAAVVYHLAQQQVEFEQRLGDIISGQAVDHERLSKMADYMRNFIQQTNTRLTSMELRLDPAASVSDEQAAEIALAVKNVAHAMDEQGQSGSYGKVYSEMYRRYRISSYKNLSRAKYDEVLGWLSKWYDEVMGENKLK